MENMARPRMPSCNRYMNRGTSGRTDERLTSGAPPFLNSQRRGEGEGTWHNSHTLYRGSALFSLNGGLDRDVVAQLQFVLPKINPYPSL